MKRQPSSHCRDTAPPPKSRTRLPSQAPIIPSKTEFISEGEDKMQCTPSPGPSTSSTHSPGKRAPSHNSNLNWAQDHRSKRARILANNQRLSHLESQTHSHTMHPSELPLPRNDPQYSTVWSTRGLDVNAPPLPITTTRNEEFDHCIDPHGSSRLSIVASAEDQGHGDQQVKVKIESNSPDYGLTTLPGPREPEGYNDSELQQDRNARDPFKSPNKPVLFYSPFQRSARRSEEHDRPRQLSNGLYQSIEGNDFNDDDDDDDDDEEEEEEEEEPPPQLATEKLWNAMYRDDDIDDTQLKRDLRRLSEGAEDLKKNFRLLRTDSTVLER